MPARGRIDIREFSAAEGKALDAEAAARRISPKAMRALLGGKTCDVFLNEAVCWRNIPLAVWEYHIGGYQIVKKWLSYREKDLLARPLRETEAVEVVNMARRLTAIVLPHPKLDANYEFVQKNLYEWPLCPGNELLRGNASAFTCQTGSFSKQPPVD
jgi:hypothetical protein